MHTLPAIKTTLCLLGATLFAWGAEVSLSLVPPQIYQRENYSMVQSATASNSLNRYTFSLLQAKPHGTVPPKALLWLSAEHLGFCPLNNFLRINVNGIPHYDLIPKPGAVARWEAGNCKGSETTLNFNGTKIILRLYMRPDSPVLWGFIRPQFHPTDTARDISLTFTAIVSNLARHPKTKEVLWDNAYERVAVTPQRTLTQQKGPQTLTPEDTYLVLQDQRYDGSSEQKGWGPCMILLDHHPIQQATLKLHNSWLTQLTVQLKKDADAFRFGLWQQSPRISNQTFEKQRQNHPETFQFN